MRGFVEVEEGDIGGPSLPDPSNGKPADIAMRSWAVQIGAFSNVTIAQAQLAKYAERTMDVVGQSKRLVTPVATADGKTMYRARFGLYAEGEARQVCKRLMQRGDTCFVTRQN
jgi:D-alanyl-D-alanine carboxypeptidase